MVCTRCGIVGADARPNWHQPPPRESPTGVQRRSLNDEQRRALRIPASSGRCAQAVLLAEGFSVGPLTVLVRKGLAKKRLVQGGGHKRVWMQITDAGRMAIAE
jgi:hypothetical protein